MSNLQLSCTWDSLCEYIVGNAGSDDDFMLLSHDIEPETSLLDGLPREMVIERSSSASNMILNAAGFALNGKKPWIVGSSSALVVRSYAQIREALAITSMPVKIAVCDGGLSMAEEGASSQIMEDIALMRSMPNMCVLIPSDRDSVFGVAAAASNVNGPVYIRLGQTPLPNLTDTSGDKFYVGGARLLREGSGVTICTCGIMVHQALKAAEILDQQGISAEIIDCYSIKPFPEQILLASVRRTGCCVVAAEQSIVGGLCGAVAECLVMTYPVPVRFVAADDQFMCSGMPEELREYIGLTWREIVNAAAQAWALRRR